ncbi:MAG: hypothetical protein BWY57_02229 [Betaproteobacteria bacterium ADurb.Bin341]|nr:MAG: hypothetical protein BWY57_02229 [Betaproteobacteria bacterium ADurb.Bin341]
MGKIVVLLQRQGVHVGAQADHPPAATGTQNADHPGAGQTPVHFESITFQLSRHQVGSALFLKGQFRMGVYLAPQRLQFFKKGEIQGGHFGLVVKCADGAIMPGLQTHVAFIILHPWISF